MGLMRRLAGPANRSGIVQTRLGVCLAVLITVWFAGVFGAPRRVTVVLVTYFFCTVLFARFCPPHLLARKRFRAIPLSFDVAAIAFLEASGGGIERSLYVLYLFPVLSAARYLGPLASVAIATLAAVVHWIASHVADGGPVEFPAYLLHAFVFIGVAATAANLARARRSKEAKVVTAIARIDRQILGNSKLETLGNVYENALGVSSNVVGSTMPPLGPAMEETIPEVVKTVRVRAQGNSFITVGDRKYYTDKLAFTEDSFFEVFSGFQLLQRQNGVLLDKPRSAVMTQSFAEKVFGRENPMGKQAKEKWTRSLWTHG